MFGKSPPVKKSNRILRIYSRLCKEKIIAKLILPTKILGKIRQKVAIQRPSEPYDILRGVVPFYSLTCYKFEVSSSENFCRPVHQRSSTQGEMMCSICVCLSLDSRTYPGDQLFPHFSKACSCSMLAVILDINNFTVRNPIYGLRRHPKASVNLSKLYPEYYIFNTRPTHRRTDVNLYPPKRQLTKASEPSFDLEGGGQGQI